MELQSPVVLPIGCFFVFIASASSLVPLQIRLSVLRSDGTATEEVCEFSALGNSRRARSRSGTAPTPRPRAEQVFLRAGHRNVKRRRSSCRSQSGLGMMPSSSPATIVA